MQRGVAQGAWMRFMFRMQCNGQQPNLIPEPHLGLRPRNQPLPASKPHTLPHQSAIPDPESLAKRGQQK